jgi:hypothetical protein
MLIGYARVSTNEQETTAQAAAGTRAAVNMLGGSERQCERYPRGFASCVQVRSAYLCYWIIQVILKIHKGLESGHTSGPRLFQFPGYGRI